MSGGVDSTASALMLREKADITGFFMNIGQPDFDNQKTRVVEIADKIGVPLTIIDLREQFNDLVLKYFSDSYKAGITPNPCVICNKEVKFGLFAETMLQSGAEFIATGHYAVVEKNDDLFVLKQGVDPIKDQSYFLCRLSQQQLAHFIFPLGSYEKAAIYDFVKEKGFTDFEGKESQDVCFLKDTKVGEYLEQLEASMGGPGEITTIDGRVLGQHKGLHHYTIGQRKGLGISDVTPFYVIGLDATSNRVLIGKNDDLLKASLTVTDMHWMSGFEPELDREYMVRIRYTHRGTSAALKKISDRCFMIVFSSPQRAVTPGQFAAVYDGNTLIGSGVIQQ